MKRIIAILTVMLLVLCFAACGGDDSDETTADETTVAAEQETNPMDAIESIELNTVEDGVAYWDVWIKDDVDWESLGFVDQSEVAVATIVECVGREETPDVDHCWIDAYQGPDANPAFAWAIDQSDRVVIYKNDGTKDVDYLLEQDDVDKILKAKEGQ